MTETLYLVISRPARRQWAGPRIETIKRRKPRLKRPSEQALVRLNIVIPNDVLEPRSLRVEIPKEALQLPPLTVQATTP